MRRLPARPRLLVSFALCGLAGAHAARAQLIEQYFPADLPGFAPDLSGSVVQRMLGADQSQGVNVGSFIVRPQIGESAGYQTDILGTGNSGSSTLTNAASVKISSDWDRNALGANFSVDNKLYPELPVANQTNWTASLGGALSLGNDAATAAYTHLAEHLNATDLGVAGVVDPVPYTVDNVRLAYLAPLGRVSLSPSFTYQDFQFGQSSGATVANFDTLNHQTASGALSTLLEISPGNNAVAIGRYTTAQFGLAPTSDYHDEGGFLGLDFRSDAVLQYRLLGGVERRQIFHAGQTITTPTFQLDAVWLPSLLDTITATGSRQLEDPTSPFALNQTVTNGQLQLAHELRRDVFLRANASLGETVTQAGNGGADNRQTQWGVGAGAIWNINRNLRGTLNYSYNQGTASGPANNAAGSGFSTFSSSSVTLGISLFE